MHKIALLALTLAAFAASGGVARAAETPGAVHAMGHGSAQPAGNGVFDAAIATFDWHPEPGGFLLSAGVVIDDIRVAAAGRAPAGGITTPDEASAPARIPSRRQLAPYLGIGYRASDTGFYGRAGVVATLTAPQDSPRRAQDQTIYPVLELGWSHRFSL